MAPGSGGNNAECRTFSNVPLNSTNSTGTRRFGDYYYRATNISGGANWLETRYNDGHTSSAASNSVSTYSNNLYDGDPTNDADTLRNTDSDGHICLGQCVISGPPRYERTIVVYSTYAPPSAAGTGTIRVCQAVGEVDGANTTITTGADQAGAVLSTRFTDGNPFPPRGEVAPSVPNGTDFTLPLNLNTRIAGFPDGSGFGSYNAECRVYTNLILESHYYRPTTITGGSNWLDPLYHDNWTENPSLSNMSIYYNNLFDGDPSNDADNLRNVNADGNMCLGSCSNGVFFSQRLLMLYARYNRLAAATPAPQFFQIFRGNVYSDSNDNPSIDSPVGTGQSFVINPPGIVLARNAIDFSGGQATPLNQKDEAYPTISDSNRVNYQAMWDKYKNDVQILNISGKSVVQDSGVYLHNGLLGDNDLLFNSSAWDSWTVQNKVTIFVDGDLYINRDINVADNGQALLTLVVSGSVGIGPDVTNVDAVLIANQTLDTACDPNLSPGKFDGSGKCRPHDNQITTVPQLELNGMFILNGGAYLDRKNASSGDPAELFSLRPDFYLSAAQRLGLARYNWIELRE
ncbi:MAG: hypothetical protein KatS3mg087_1422 [Patescibacteria group bacterium]|nr:MAG: hypothetical protein KatS3mg087_1422 [Patescibacteria group bacterium]